MPGIATVGALPGWGPQQDALGRRIFWTQDHNVFAPGGLVIDGTNSRDLTNLTVAGAAQYDVLQAGLVMGRETTSGFYRNSIIGALTAAVTAGTVTSLTVSAAVASEVARLIANAGGNVNLTIIGPPSANGAASAVVSEAVVATAASGTTITITSLTLPAMIAGSFVCPADGSQVPKCLIVKEDGIEIMDRFGNYYNAQFPEALVGGAIESAQIVNYPTDTGLQAWLKAQLRAVGIGYIFRDDF
jgi:hypothetical protein